MKIKSDKRLTYQGTGIRAGKWFTITPEMGEVSWPREVCEGLIAMGATAVTKKAPKRSKAESAENRE